MGRTAYTEPQCLYKGALYLCICNFQHSDIFRYIHIYSPHTFSYFQTRITKAALMKPVLGFEVAVVKGLSTGSSKEHAIAIFRVKI